MHRNHTLLVFVIFVKLKSFCCSSLKLWRSLSIFPEPQTESCTHQNMLFFLLPVWTSSCRLCWSVNVSMPLWHLEPAAALRCQLLVWAHSSVGPDGGCQGFVAQSLGQMSQPVLTFLAGECGESHKPCLCKRRITAPTENVQWGWPCRGQKDRPLWSVALFCKKGKFWP